MSQVEVLMSRKWLLFLGAFIGALTFLLIHGYAVLDPTYISWTLYGDPAKQFLGWHFFRSEPWALPLGTLRSYLYPDETSIVYTVSIPIIALPLKLLSPVLPEIFQYRGPWILLSYILQGLFAALLLQRFSRNPVLVSLGVVFFVLSPIIFRRTYAHTSLTSHWLLLAALYCYFKTDTSLRTKVQWSVVLVATSLVHFYLLVMNLAIFAAYLGKQLVLNFKRNVTHVGVLMASVAGVVVMAMWMAGYFVLDLDATGAGIFGYGSMNLLSPFFPSDPMQGPTFFARNVPLATHGQSEGFSYFGFGLLLLVCFSIPELLRRWRATGKVLLRHAPLALAALALTVLAVSHRVTFADLVLFEIPVSSSLLDSLATIRASGRMFWPVTYLVMLAALAVIFKSQRTNQAIIILVMCGSAQAIDLFPWYQSVSLDTRSWSTPLRSSIWDTMAADVGHIAFIPPQRQKDDYIPFALLAANHQKTFNAGYVARNSDRTNYTERLVDDLRNGNLDDDTLHVLRQGYLFAPPTDTFTYGTLDGYRIVAPRNVLEPLTRELTPFTYGTLDSYQIVTPRSVLKPLTQGLTPWPFQVVNDSQPYSLDELLEAFSTPGYAIFMAVKDEASRKMPRDFMESMTAMGSNIAELGFRDAYAAVIVDGDLKVEQVDTDGLVRILYRELGNYAPELVSSSIGHGNSATIRIAGEQVALDRRGLNIIVLNIEEGLLRRYHYDTYLSDSITTGSE